MKKTIFTGTATALITPFCEDCKDVDYVSFERLVDFQLENSVDALVVAGTTGESPALTSGEKAELFRIARCMCKDTPVIAGTGSNNTIEAVKKSNDAEKQGVDGLLIVTPYYNKCNQEGLIEHYNFIADRVSTPIIIYNVPSRTGVNISAETYKALSEHKNITAVKEASGNISEAAKAMALCDNSLDFYSGNDDQLLPMLSLGAKGVISVASNLIPDKVSAIINYFDNKDYASAKKLYFKYLELFNALFIDVNPIPVKEAMSRIFNCSSSLRLPLTSLQDENRIKLSAILKKYNLL